MSWQPLSDSEVTRGLAAMIVFNGLHEYADCRLCRQVPDAASAPREIAQTIRGLLEDELFHIPHFLAGNTEDNNVIIRERERKYQDALAWLEEIKGEATDE